MSEPVEVQLGAGHIDWISERHKSQDEIVISIRTASHEGGVEVTTEFRTFVDRIVVPALLDRFLRDQSIASISQTPPTRPAA